MGLDGLELYASSIFLEIFKDIFMNVDISIVFGVVEIFCCNCEFYHYFLIRVVLIIIMYFCPCMASYGSDFH